jgi:hypothetical protein
MKKHDIIKSIWIIATMARSQAALKSKLLILQPAKFSGAPKRRRQMKMMKAVGVVWVMLGAAMLCVAEEPAKQIDLEQESKAGIDQGQPGKFFDKHNIMIGEKSETAFLNKNGVSPDGTVPMYRDTSGKLWAMCGHSHAGHIAMFSGTCLDDMKKTYPISTNFRVGSSDHAFSGVRYPEGVKARGSNYL